MGDVVKPVEAAGYRVKRGVRVIADGYGRHYQARWKHRLWALIEVDAKGVQIAPLSGAYWSCGTWKDVQDTVALRASAVWVVLNKIVDPARRYGPRRRTTHEQRVVELWAIFGDQDRLPDIGQITTKQRLRLQWGVRQGLLKRMQAPWPAGSLATCTKTWFHVVQGARALEAGTVVAR